MNALLHTERFRNLKEETEWAIVVYLDRKKLTEKMKQDGMEAGTRQGIERGIQRANSLTKILVEQGARMNLKRALEDAVYQEGLFRELGL